MKISTLEPGARFRLPDSGKTGVLVSVGDSGARVKYDASARQVEITQDGEITSFESPGKAVSISSGTEVEVL
jgi:hypothetical protein